MDGIYRFDMFTRNVRKGPVQRIRQLSGTMRAWLCEEYGKPLVLKDVPIPTVKGHDEVLIKVKAASVNPIDVRMSEGYARELMTMLRCVERSPFKNVPRLPLSFGRDFSGGVVQSNAAHLQVGQEVIGVVPPAWPGAHAEYVLTRADLVAPKPDAVDHPHSAAMIYTTATAWSALVRFARFTPANAAGQRVLVHGGSGGVGTAAIQLLHEWGAAKVVATASAAHLHLVRRLNAVPVDYAAADARAQLAAHAPFDTILDCCAESDLARWSDVLLGPWRNAVHLGLTSPLMANTDEMGPLCGSAATAAQWLARNLNNFRNGRAYLYAYFIPEHAPLAYLSRMLTEGKMEPVVENVYSFDQLNQAYSRVGALKGGGKSVIQMSQ